ncbi:MAG: DUF4350 domain-containing protein [Planctomycetes bacterium]|nr:DUF4350 domain-containing protein [Planctomycetota bacterium]
MSEPARKVNPVHRETIFRVVMVGAFVVTTVFWLVVGIFDVPLVPDNFTNSHSGSPGGHHAFVELLKENGRTVRREAARLELPEYNSYSGATLMILEPRPEFVDEYPGELENLLKDARNRPTSVVLALPKRAYYPEYEDENGDLVLTEVIFPPDFIDDLMRQSGFDRWFKVGHDRRDKVPVVTAYSDRHSQVSAEIHHPVQVLRPLRDVSDLPANVQVIASTDRGDVIAVRLRGENDGANGGLVLVSDPDMFTNRFLGKLGMSDLAMAMLRHAPPKGEIVIDEALHGFGADSSLAYLAATPPGLWVTLSVILLMLLFGWRQATVLRPIDAEVQDRAERRYAIEGLARMMERTGAHDEAARRIVRRSWLVLGQGAAQVQGAGRVTTAIRKGRTGRIVKMSGESSEEKLVNIARRVARQKRTGETEHSQLWSD